MSHEVSFTGQITPDQVPMIAENGFKTIINNRPDGEEPNQPTSAEIEAAAKKQVLLIKKCLSPVASSIKTMLKNLLTFNQAEQPILIFAVPVTAQRVSMKQQSVWIC